MIFNFFFIFIFILIIKPPSPPSLPFAISFPLDHITALNLIKCEIFSKNKSSKLIIKTWIESRSRQNSKFNLRYQNNSISDIHTRGSLIKESRKYFESYFWDAKKIRRRNMNKNTRSFRDVNRQFFFRYLMNFWWQKKLILSVTNKKTNKQFKKLLNYISQSELWEKFEFKNFKCERKKSQLIISYEKIQILMLFNFFSLFFSLTHWNSLI